MNTYKFTIEATVKGHSDEIAYETLLTHIRSMYGLCTETVGCDVNGKPMLTARFDRVKDAVLRKEDD